MAHSLWEQQARAALRKAGAASGGWARQAAHRAAILLDQAFPAPCRLAYTFKPGTADLVTLALVVAGLLPLARGTLPQTLLTLALLLHVGATLAGHALNISKLRVIEQLASSAAQQQQLLQAKHDALSAKVAAGGALQAEVTALEARVREAAMLEGRAAAARRATQCLPRLHMEVARLQAKYRTVERLKWAVKVLQAETRQAGELAQQYAQLKAARAEQQAVRQGRPSAHAAPQQLSSATTFESLPATTRDTEASSRTPRNHPVPAGVAVPQPLSPGVARRVEMIAARTVGASAAASRAAAAAYGPTRSTDSLSLNTLNPNQAAGRARLRKGVGTESAGAGASSPTSRLAHSGGAAASSARDTSGALKPVGSSSARVMRGVSSSEGGAAGGPASQPTTATGLRPTHSSASSGRRSVVLGTPTGGANVFGFVVDNEAFFTPSLPKEENAGRQHRPSGSNNGSAKFTPGPEAAALAAALSAGTMAVPSRSGNAAAPGSKAAPTRGAEAEGDDATYPAADQSSRMPQPLLQPLRSA